jgi:hypothetical protein
MGKQLAYFPTPYPDELLYSIFARYHLRSCNISIPHTLNDLFGSPSATLDDLPARLSDLIERLPSQTAFTPTKLIQEHTMLPYYKPFIAPEWLDSANLNAYEEETKFRVMSIVCTIQKRKYLHQTLHYCPKCYESDELNYGEPYWHRSHQVLGILRCHRHKAWLIDSKIKLKPVGARQPLVPLGPETFSDKPISSYSFAFKLHDWLAKQVYWLINGNHSGAPCHPTILLNRYRYHLERMGLIYDTGFLVRCELLRRFLNFYSVKFLKDICCALNESSTGNWLTNLFLPSSLENRPLFHLLAMRFLGVDPKAVLWDKNENVQPFGEGPWPCLNRIADHYLKSVVKKCSISKNSSTNLVTGTFTCECGFKYERNGPDSSLTNRTTFNEIVATGSLWDKELMRLLLKGRRLVKVARDLGVRKSFVAQKLASLAEHETDNLSFDDFFQILTQYGNKWQEICGRFSRDSIEYLH